MNHIKRFICSNESNKKTYVEKLVYYREKGEG